MQKEDFKNLIKQGFQVGWIMCSNYKGSFINDEDSTNKCEIEFGYFWKKYMNLIKDTVKNDN